MSADDQRLGTADIADADRTTDRDDADRALRRDDTGLDGDRRDETVARADAEAGVDDGDGEAVSFIDEGEAADLRERWQTIQTQFVDSPRDAVQQADALVAEAVQTVARTFATERDGLEEQWNRGDDVSTEDLRVALQRYRSFFERLLAA